jgi:hypothetical protein
MTLSFKSWSVTCSGEYSISTLLDAKLTAALFTPACDFNILSTLPAQAAQDMPVTGYVFLMVDIHNKIKLLKVVYG